MSNQLTPGDPKDFDDPPPPPDGSSDDEQDVGLATEMVFSGKRRQELREHAAYETLQTGEVSFEDEQDLYDDVEAGDEEDEHSTELLLTENHSDQPRQDFGNYRTASFDPNQYYLQQTGTTNEPLALTMLLVLSVVVLGIFGVLGLLIYRLIIGA